MPVVINEVEVLDAGATERRTEHSEAQPQRELLPVEEDLRRLLATIAEHELRIWSH